METDDVNKVGGTCPLIAAFDEIRSGGLSTDEDDQTAVVIIGGDESAIVWNEPEYWIAKRSVAIARGQLLDRAQETFVRLYPGGIAAGDELASDIMRESPVIRQLSLLRPVLNSLAESVISRALAASIRSQSINISVGSLPDTIDPTTTNEIPSAVNQLVDFANSLDVSALGASYSRKIERMTDDHVPDIPRIPVATVEEGKIADKKIAAVGITHEKLHAEAAHKLNEIFVFCREICDKLA